MTGRFYVRNDRSVMRIGGRDARDFLQRLTTNELAAMSDGDARDTLLLDAKGKTTGLLRLCAREGEFLALVPRSQCDAIRASIEHHTIMDDVRVDDVSGEWAAVSLWDVEASEVLGALPREGRWEERLLDSTSAIVLRGAVHVGPGVTCLVPAATRTQVLAFCAASGFRAASTEEYDAFRIAHGIADAPNELSEKFNPLESGGASLINFSKGCYLGQEVFARLDSQQKVQRVLVRVSVTRQISTPATISAADNPVGLITTISPSSKEAPYSCLAVVRIEHARAGTRLKAGDVDAEVSAIV